MSYDYILKWIAWGLKLHLDIAVWSERTLSSRSRSSLVSLLATGRDVKSKEAATGGALDRAALTRVAVLCPIRPVFYGPGESSVPDPETTEIPEYLVIC